MNAPSRFKDLCLDARDHQMLADWWCRAMGYVRRDEVQPDPDWVRPSQWPVPLVDRSGNGPTIWIVPVPEEKSVKNRMHIDVIGDTQQLVGLGARVIRGRDDEIDWDVLVDPEGNEFCCFAPTE